MALYKDYFGIRPDYAPCMTLADINKTPKTWLGFYPHETFVEILRELLKSLDGGNKTLWITGAYGTGKSHASLVLQKLFMDEDERVLEWLAARQDQIPDSVRRTLLARRNEKILFVYDVNSDDVDAKNQFLMRLQRAITKMLASHGCSIPLKGKLEDVIERIRQDGQYFFDKRDEMQARLSHLNTGIKTADALGKKLLDTNLESGLVSDVMQVLEARDIYMNLSAEDFLAWVNELLNANGFSRIIYVWDEFSSFMERNRTQLKTLEQLAEAAQQGQFYFVPVTHTEISSYLGSGSESAKKANNRFIFKQLDMPNDTAIKLAADAIVVKPGKEQEWSKDRDELWYSVKGVADNYMANNNAGISSADFKGILPLHPMAAFLLKHLSVVIGANQRSMFEFLNSGEFKSFIESGGLDVPNHQFLTIDHLWSYFVERDDLGTDKSVREARAEYARRKNDLQPDECRVFKAVLLYGLVEQMQGEVHPLLSVTLENIKRSFEGDGALAGVDMILRNLETKHCFSIYNGRCERFHNRMDTKEIEDKKLALDDKFGDLVLGDTQKEISRQLSMITRSGRFDIQAADIRHLSPSSIKKRESFGDKGYRVLVQFILARDEQEQLLIPDKAKALAKQFNDHRMLFVTFPSINFCRDNSAAWDEFVENSARLALANDVASKNVFETQINSMKSMWCSRITTADKLTVYKPNPNGELFVEEITWGQLKKTYLFEYAKQSFAAYTDDLCDGNLSALGVPNALRSWALAGIWFDKFSKPGAWNKVVKIWQDKGIDGDDTWFDNNPNHPLTQLKDKCKAWQNNTVGAGNTCSIRKLYIELQRPPFGLLSVPHSAMVMGFVLKTWLTGQRKLQWTDGVTSKTLDADALAEIIETVVRDDGANKIRTEKLICRLSKEEAAFIKQSSIIFGSSAISDGTVEAALNAVGTRLEQMTQHVPLWVLPKYIFSKNDQNAEAMSRVINALCEANSISSKGDAEVRGNKVKEIGEILLATPGLAEAMSDYMTPVNFDKAFHLYVDEAKPELKDVANRIKAPTRTYCDLAKRRFAATSGWLWKRGDTDTILEEVFREMLCVEHIGWLSGMSAYMTFDDAVNRLRNAVQRENKVPTWYWEKSYPQLQRFFELLYRTNLVGEDIIVLEEVLRLQRDLIRELFFDVSQTKQLDAMMKIFGNIWPKSVSEASEVYGVLPLGIVHEDEQGFKLRVRSKIEEFNHTLISNRVLLLWRELTGANTPDDWSRKHLLPAECILAADDANRIIDAIMSPSDVSAERLRFVLSELERDNAIVDETEAAAKFLKRVLPARYYKIGIDVEKLSRWLYESLGDTPDQWLADEGLSDAVESFVEQEYDAHTKEKALAKVRTLSGADAKALLIKLVNKISAVGFSVLE